MKTPQERFFDKVNKDGPIQPHTPHLGKCWIWIAGKDGAGYGDFWMDGRLIKAHRASFSFAGGVLDPDKEICHSCDNPPCINPTHLFQGTGSDNVQDALSKGRMRNQQILKTHCPKGHAYNFKNTRITKRGHRKCRECDKVFSKNRHLKSAISTAMGKETKTPPE